MNTSTDSTPLITSKLSASQKGFSPLFIILGIILVIGIVGGAYYLGKAQNPKPQPQNPVITSQTPKPTLTPQPTPTTASSPKYAAFMRNGQIWFMDFTVSRIVKDLAVKVSKTDKVDSPKLSSNGNYVAYFQIVHATGGFPTGNVYLADTQGKTEVTLGVTNDYASRLTWSDDGNIVGLILFPSGATGQTVATIYDFSTQKKVQEVELNTLRDNQYGQKVLTIDKNHNVNLNCAQLAAPYVKFCNQFQSILNKDQNSPATSYKQEQYSQSQYTKSNYILSKSEKLQNGLAQLEYYTGEPQNPESKGGEGGGSFVPGYDNGVTQTYTVLIDESTGKVVKEIPLAINTDFIF